MKVKVSNSASTQQLADEIVMASIRLTRTLRALNRSFELSGPQISIMAVVVHAGRIAARDLAKLEEVTPATISRQVADLEQLGLLVRHRDARDTRLQWIEATARGQRLVAEGHRRRLQPLVQSLGSLTPLQRERLSEAARLTEHLAARMKADQ